MLKRPLDIDEKYAKELKAKGEEKYFRSDYIMFIRDEYMKYVKQAVQKMYSGLPPRGQEEIISSEDLYTKLDNVFGNWEEE